MLVKRFTNIINLPINVEVNGPANIIIHLETMLIAGVITPEHYSILKSEAERTIKYMRLLNNPKAIAWHEVK